LERLFLQADRHALSTQLHGVAVEFKDSEAEYARHSITSVSALLYIKRGMVSVREIG
jgi:hypothetical protein